MASYSRYLVPSLTPGTLFWVEQALLASGYVPSADGEMLLHATVRKIVHGTGTFAEIFQPGEGPWDPWFARQLSQITDGFVSTITYRPVPGLYGEGLFFAGQTLQVRSWPPELDYGPPRTDAERTGMSVENLYLRRFGYLCSDDVLARDYSEVVAERTWQVTPNLMRFDPKGEPGLMRMLAGNVPPEKEAQLLAATALPGWNRRLRHAPLVGSPYIELGGGNTFDTEALAQLSAAVDGTALLFHIPGGSRPSRWAGAYKGVVDDGGVNVCADSLLGDIYASCFLLGDVPGMLFGYAEDNKVDSQEEKY